MPTVEVQLANSLADVQLGSIRATKQSDKPGFQALYYWQRTESTYPSVAPLALDVLSMPLPASKAYAERVFSVCGCLLAGETGYQRIWSRLRQDAYNVTETMTQ